MNQKASAEVIADLEARDLLSLVGAICAHYHVPIAEVCGRRRFGDIAHARKVVWWILFSHHDLNIGFAPLGRLFGRDHTTIMSGIGSVGTAECHRVERTGAHLRAEAIKSGHSVLCAEYGNDPACPIRQWLSLPIRYVPQPVEVQP